MRETARRNGDQAYGACVADAQGRVIAEAPSRVVSLNDVGAHAERQAINAAKKILERDYLIGYVWVGTSPACTLCERAAMRAGIAHLVWQGGEAETPLIASVERNDLSALSRALDEGAPIDTTDLRRRTALLVAVQGNHEALAQTMIRRGADINVQDEIEDSAFLLAGARGRKAMLTGMLLPPTGSATRPDYRKLNRYGGTALLEAVILGDGGPKYVEIVRLLLEHHANPSKPDNQGISPLIHARQRRQHEVAALIAGACGR
jgi:uncharacterized protein